MFESLPCFKKVMLKFLLHGTRHFLNHNPRVSVHLLCRGFETSYQQLYQCSVLFIENLEAATRASVAAVFKVPLCCSAPAVTLVGLYLGVYTNYGYKGLKYGFARRSKDDSLRVFMCSGRIHGRTVAVSSFPFPLLTLNIQQSMNSSILNGIYRSARIPLPILNVICEGF
eukprot:Gb_09520 [translate_table: standard]